MDELNHNKGKQINSSGVEALTGLNTGEVLKQREANGMNVGTKPKNLFFQNVLSVAIEPMFILLVVTCIIYFLLKEVSEALTMLAALLFVAGIDVFQNFRSQKAVKALNKITESHAQVIRNSTKIQIPISEIVTQDIIICEEGNIIPADAEIISSNDFSVNEAILTGESVSVEKFKGDAIMQGTLVVRGYCYAKVSSVGKQTALSQIGNLVSVSEKERTPLQIKISKFVRSVVIAGGFAFILVWAYHWWESGSVIHGLLHGLTMIMSVVPEEIPVALSTFIAIGAYRLLKKGVIARSAKTVETLGSATVICVDKTGTLTQNLMNVHFTYDALTGEETDFINSGKPNQVIEYAMWASEENPFDPMEKSIHKIYSEFFKTDQRAEYKMDKEYPLAGTPPTMTHIFKNAKNDMIISCKGSLEGVLKLCSLSEDQTLRILKKGEEYAKNGLRVLGVAKGLLNGNEYPESQEKIQFEFLGIITFYDPPDPHISEVIQAFYKAGLDVKMITGDYPETALSIARLTGIKTDKILTGKELSELSGEELIKLAPSVNIFARVSPESKLKIITALKGAGEIVSMTGDGVNDAPSLKAAHVGIAMGRRGTEVAKGAAALILSNDDLSNMVDAIYLGRRINKNLTKAIRYIISIHIPIILLVILPIFFDWLPALLLSPVHVIFLELIMGPTCSIIYENEPTPNEELKKPASFSHSGFLRRSEILVTVLQGLVITTGCMLSGYYAVHSGFDELKVRACIFATLIFSNIFLTLFNRSFERTFITTIKMKNKLVPLIIFVTFSLLILILNVAPLSHIFKVSPLAFTDYLWILMVAIVSTVWLEFFKRSKKPL